VLKEDRCGWIQCDGQVMVRYGPVAYRATTVLVSLCNWRAASKKTVSARFVWTIGVECHNWGKSWIGWI